MFKSTLLLFGALLCFSVNGCAQNKGPQKASQPSDKPLIMVHYMPWYQAQPLRQWGWHWTMNHFDPDQSDSEGRREIASHFYPLTGPYDSNDEKIIEYQVLLMKLSGIDGLIADWYGSEHFLDYGLINQSTAKIFNSAEKAGLLFAVCYEDQSIKHMIDHGQIQASQAIAHGRMAMEFLEDEWFASDLYLKFRGKPVLLNFGPQYFFASAQWDQLFSTLNTNPLFFTLDNPVLPAATGAFPWPPMYYSVNGILSLNSLHQYLSSFYQKANAWLYTIGGAFPGFHDIYAEAGQGSSYGYLDASDGQTFTSTMQKAIDNNSDVIQIITWNDFGEGTNIEPTLEYGYQYLEIIQNMRKASIDTNFNYSADDLLLPFEIYKLRLKYEYDAQKNALLDDVFNAIAADDLSTAKTILKTLGVDIEYNESEVLLDQNYPNPFKSQTTIAYKLSEFGKVNLSIYNVAGKLIDILVDHNQEQGTHSIPWDAGSQPSGVYLCKVVSGNSSEIKKMVLVR